MTVGPHIKPYLAEITEEEEEEESEPAPPADGEVTDAKQEENTASLDNQYGKQEK